MCLAIPSKVIEIDHEMNSITVDTMGAARSASLDLLPEPVEIGDYVILHVGFAIRKVDEKSAIEVIDYYNEILADEQEE